MAAAVALAYVLIAVSLFVRAAVDERTDPALVDDRKWLMIYAALA